MGQPKKVIPSAPLTVRLPEPLLNRLTLYLWSEAEARVPHGEHQLFFTSLLNRFFSNRELDLAPYLGTPAGSYIINGTPAVVEALEQYLRQYPHKEVV